MNTDESNISNKSAEEDKTTEENIDDNKVDETNVDEESKSDKKDKEVLFDDDQQKKVNQIVRERTSRLETKVSKVTEENEALLTEIKDLKESLSGASEKQNDLQRDLTKAQVAISEKVDLKLVESLKGETEEELLAALKVVKDAHSENAKDKYTNIFSGKNYKTDEDNELDNSGLIYMK